MNVRSWLRRVPQPVKVRLDGKKEIRVGEGKNRWRDVLEVIEQDQPAKVEALDAEGAVIRQTQLQDADDAPAAEASPAVGKLPPEFAVLQAFGELLLQAYVRGAEQHARAYELAFAENTKLVTALSQQSRNLQHSLEAQLEARLQAAEAGDEGAVGDIMSGPLAPMIQAFMMKQLNGKSDAASTNGKKKGA